MGFAQNVTLSQEHVLAQEIPLGSPDCFSSPELGVYSGTSLLGAIIIVLISEVSLFRKE